MTSYASRPDRHELLCCWRVGCDTSTLQQLPDSFVAGVCPGFSRTFQTRTLCGHFRNLPEHFPSLQSCPHTFSQSRTSRYAIQDLFTRKRSLASTSHPNPDLDSFGGLPDSPTYRNPWKPPTSHPNMSAHVFRDMCALLPLKGSLRPWRGWRSQRCLILSWLPLLCQHLNQSSHFMAYLANFNR